MPPRRHRSQARGQVRRAIWPAVAGAALAGIGGGAPITEQTLEGWRRVLSVNLDGAFLCFRAAARWRRAWR